MKATHVLSGVVGGILVSFVLACFFIFGLFEFSTSNTVTEPFQSPSKYSKEVGLAKSYSKAVKDGTAFSFSNAAELATPVVVHIRAEESQEQLEDRRRRKNPFSFEHFFGRGLSPFYRREGSGSGVIFSSDGFIVTNNHVVEFADVITVTLYDGRTFEAAKIGTAPEDDIAVLKIDAVDLPTIPWANTEEVSVGDWVLAIGNPFDYLTSTVTAGIVSAKGRDLDIQVNEGRQTFTNFIQTDAAVNPGNSGGALVNTEGELLGINSAIATPTGVFAGYSFAIPVENVQKIVKKIIARSTNMDMGISVTNMDGELADYLNIETTEGVLILETESGSAAQYGGLKPYDLILSVNDIPVNSISDFESVLYNDNKSDVLLLRILRDGREKFVNIKLK
ncbi:MAG: PDZ domain-containing protein [Bacteroidetes bacterium]|jgi:S1-C subfamily serine protease|nr:PDZ domain-containing protein [Bacteroidota bacterium]